MQRVAYRIGAGMLTNEQHRSVLRQVRQAEGGQDQGQVRKKRRQKARLHERHVRLACGSTGLLCAFLLSLLIFPFPRCTAMTRRNSPSRTLVASLMTALQGASQDRSGSGSTKRTRLKQLGHRSDGARRKLPPPRVLLVLPAVIAVGFVLLLRRRHATLPVQDGVVYVLSRRGAHLNTTLPGGSPVSHDVSSYIPYHNLYVKLPQWLGISLLVLWLCFLFSFLGIVASDFFCPNLSTLASRLGLPEDVAGATMVGWANGAPDLFSTFASLKAGSGSLAIGELIGAASFICCIVAGSMVLVKPFKIKRFNFFRDVGFFTLAVALSIFILRDGRIHEWEGKLMIGLYLLYVLLIAIGSWVKRRRWRQKERERLIRDAWNENVTEVPPYRETDPGDAPAYLDETSERPELHQTRSRSGLPPLTIPALRLPPSVHSPSLQDSTEQRLDYFTSSPAPVLASTSTSRRGTPLHSPHLVPLVSPAVSTGVAQAAGARKRSSTVTGRDTPGTPGGHKHAHSRSASHHHIHGGGVPHLQGRMSFLGAVEFRDVVNSLQAESTAHKHLAAFEQPAASKAHTYHALLPEDGLGMARTQSGSTAYRTDGSSRTRARSSPHAPSQADLPDAPGHVRAFPDACFDDPWRGADAPAISITKPRSSNVAGLNSPGWGDVDDARPEGEHSDDASPGDSDITARPEDVASPRRKGGMGRFPNKALQVLGFGNSSIGVPPKAQRILGLEETSEAKSTISRSTRFFAISRAMTYAIFPTLHNFRSKSFLAMLTSLISVPAVLLLNLTLPVVDESGRSEEDEQAFLAELEKDRLEAEPEGQIRLGLDAEEAGQQIHYNDHGLRGTQSRRSTASQDDADQLEEAIQDRLDDMEEEERGRNVRRAVAVAHELHSPVATALHSHSARPGHKHADKHASSSSRSSLLVSFDEQGGHLAVPGQRNGTETPVLPPANDISVGAAAVPALQDLDVHPDKYSVDPADLTRYLTAVQCLLAPPFAVLALFGKCKGCFKWSMSAHAGWVISDFAQDLAFASCRRGRLDTGNDQLPLLSGGRSHYSCTVALLHRLLHGDSLDSDDCQ